MTGNARNDSLGVVSESVDAALRREPADLTKARAMRFDELWVLPGRPLMRVTRDLAIFLDAEKLRMVVVPR